MKVRIERAKCQGHAMCFGLAPEVYDIDELGFNAVDGVIDVPEQHRAAAVRGAQSCPEGAIRMIDNDAETQSKGESDDNASR